MVGNTATDDPDGLAMYGKITEERDNDTDIFLLMNIENNDENIGALMRYYLGFDQNTPTFKMS